MVRRMSWRKSASEELRSRRLMRMEEVAQTFPLFSVRHRHQHRHHRPRRNRRNHYQRYHHHRHHHHRRHHHHQSDIVRLWAGLTNSLILAFDKLARATKCRQQRDFKSIKHRCRYKYCHIDIELMMLKPCQTYVLSYYQNGTYQVLTHLTYLPNTSLLSAMHEYNLNLSVGN